MVRIEVPLPFLNKFYGKVLPGYLTEKPLVSKYRYPDFALVLDNFIITIEKKFGMEPDYYILTKLSTLVEFEIFKHANNLNRIVKEIIVENFKEDPVPTLVLNVKYV
jgi:hypothetical protein